MTTETFISGVYNYCDRWCERCPFTKQCRTYTEQAAWEESNSDAEGDLGALIAHSLDKAINTLYEFAEKEGIELNDLTEIEEPERNKDIQAIGKVIKEKIEEYQQLAKAWFEQKEAMFLAKGKEWEIQTNIGLEAPEEELNKLQDAVDIIQWYFHFIGAKIYRAFNGFEFTERDMVQNDANGSAKVAIIAIDNSLAAWETIRGLFPDETNSLLDIMLLLHNIKKKILHHKPRALEFVRPGFDEGIMV